jgi:carotenoid cleavage dioxygenase-like enzyme
MAFAVMAFAVMAFVREPGQGATDPVILSAQDSTGAPVAQVHPPRGVPLGPHGSWIVDT